MQRAQRRGSGGQRRGSGNEPWTNNPSSNNATPLSHSSTSQCNLTHLVVAVNQVTATQQAHPGRGNAAPAPPTISATNTTSHTSWSQSPR